VKASQWVPFSSNSRASLAKTNLPDNLIHPSLILREKTTPDIPSACITTQSGAKKIRFIELVIQ